MTPARPKQTDQDANDTQLILYRIGILEGGQQRIETKIDKQDNIKKSDLSDFKQFITDRMIEFRAGLQSQIDLARNDMDESVKELKNNKADKQELTDFKKQIAGYGAVLFALGMAVFSYMLTRIK